MSYHVQEVNTGAAGVFTYFNFQNYSTLALMFSHDIKDHDSGCCGVFNVKLYDELKIANKDLYNETKNDDPWDADGQRHSKD